MIIDAMLVAFSIVVSTVVVAMLSRRYTLNQWSARLILWASMLSAIWIDLLLRRMDLSWLDDTMQRSATLAVPITILFVGSHIAFRRIDRRELPASSLDEPGE